MALEPCENINNCKWKRSGRAKGGNERKTFGKKVKIKNTRKNVYTIRTSKRKCKYDPCYFPYDFTAQLQDVNDAEKKDL